MSAHEFMNMARVRAEQAEAALALMDAELADAQCAAVEADRDKRKAERERDEAREIVRLVYGHRWGAPEMGQAIRRWDAEAEA